jgi:hypothetical protein
VIFDELSQRRKIVKKNWSRKANLRIMDDFHKMTQWKSR